MNPLENHGGPRPIFYRALFFGLLAALFCWLLCWIFHFGSTLINDEYLAIDYFYRSVARGGLYPTPRAFHKPLSVLMGFFAWAAESPLGYEVAVAVFATVFIGLLFVTVSRELGKWPAAAAILAAALHPDLIYYTAKGSTVIPFCALTFAALFAAQRREERQGWLWVYAAGLFFAGLIRTEPWILAAPIIVWWRPRDRRLSSWARPLLAMCLVGLAPVIWLGKDYFINGDLLHGFRVATRVQVVGMGAPFSLLDALLSPGLKVSNKVGWPVLLGAVAGVVVFVRERGFWKGITDPLLVFPALVSCFLILAIRLGVYPNPWYFYFDSVFAVVFFVYLCGAVLRGLESGSRKRPGDEGRKVLGRPLRAALFIPLLLIIVFYAVFCSLLYGREISELSEEAEKQREMTVVADFLKGEMKADGSERIMMPSRRNEQLSWLFRDRWIPDTVALREAFYLRTVKGIDFLSLHPDWIVYIPGDYQFWGPDNEFKWLASQDETELSGVRIELAMSTKWIRVFKVTYPPGFPEKGPLPPFE